MSWGEGRKEGNVLFNDALNIFYLRLYGDSEKGNPLPPHRLIFPINSKSFYMHHPTDRIAHTTAFVTPVVEHWLEREIAQWVDPMKDRSDDPWHHERTLLPRSYISLLGEKETEEEKNNSICDNSQGESFISARMSSDNTTKCATTDACHKRTQDINDT